MKVLHLVNSNGYHALLLDVCRQLARDGVEIILGSLDGPGALQAAAEQAGLGTLALGCRSSRDYPAAILQLALDLRRFGVDVVHTHLFDATVVGLVAARIARVPGRVMTRHHADERLIYGSSTGVLADQAIERWLCDQIVVISPAVERVLTEVEKIPAAKLRRVPNGYDWNRVRSSPQQARAVRAELGLGDDFVISIVGRVARGPAGYMKGHDQLLRAVAAAQLPADTRVLVVGTGEEAALGELARALGLGDRCRFLGQRRDAFDVMAASDVVVHPSLSEAQSQVIIEALALGRPVIASDTGAAREAVIPGETGWIVPVRDEAALARALEEAVADRACLDRMGAAGQRRVLALYPVEKMARGYRAIYDELSTRRRR